MIKDEQIIQFLKKKLQEQKNLTGKQLVEAINESIQLYKESHPLVTRGLSIESLLSILLFSEEEPVINVTEKLLGTELFLEIKLPEPKEEQIKLELPEDREVFEAELEAIEAEAAKEEERRSNSKEESESTKTSLSEEDEKFLNFYESLLSEIEL